jgi:hypothetical protein
VREPLPHERPLVYRLDGSESQGVADDRSSCNDSASHARLRVTLHGLARGGSSLVDDCYVGDHYFRRATYA